MAYVNMKGKFPYKSIITSTKLEQFAENDEVLNNKISTDIANHTNASPINHPNDSITADKVKDDNITIAKLAPNIDATAKGFNADKVDGLHASAEPLPYRLLALDGSSKFPASVISGDTPTLTAHKVANPIDHPDGSVITPKIADGNITTPKIADGSITLSKLKLSQGSWEISGLLYMGHYIIHLLSNSHFPYQTRSENFELWSPIPGDYDSNGYLLAAYKTSTYSNGTWTGSYSYHSNSEQILELMVNEGGVVVGKYIIELDVIDDSPKNSIASYDVDKKEIPHLYYRYLLVDIIKELNKPIKFVWDITDEDCKLIISKLNKIL